MSCYFRHMKDVLDEVDVEITPANKKEIDEILHGIVGVDYKNCSEAWKKIKGMVSTAIIRGEVMMEDYQTVGKPGHGRYVACCSY